MQTTTNLPASSQVSVQESTPKMSRVGAVLLAFLLSLVLTEILSGNTPLNVFLANPILLLLMVIFYGIPLLLLRELAIRWKIGFWGYFVMGLAYGIFNEGIISGTLTQATGYPVNSFADYYRIGGINTAWAIFILTWHAFHAVLYPTIILQYFYGAWKPILSKSLVILFSLPVAFFILFSLSRGDLRFVILAVMMGILILLSRLFHKKILTDENRFAMKPFWLGLIMVLYIIGFYYFSNVRPPFVSYLAFSAVVPWFVFWRLKKNSARSPLGFLMLAIGDYVFSAIFAMVTLNPFIIASNIVIILVLIGFLRSVMKQSRTLMPAPQFADL